MKVIEKGADRTSYAHLYVEGLVQPLEEYGQYVDARDGAICCYVAVKEGHKIRVDGRFSGATLTVAYDVMVDGVCRKANSYIGKSVQVQKNKKLEFEKFLYQTPDGVIDSDISVSPRPGPVHVDKDIPEAIGTIELRVYITRQFGVEHEIDDARKFYSVEEDVVTDTQSANYRDVPPQFKMTFEKNCSALEGAKENREKKKVYAKRPGKEPWVRYRFHYRSKESILDRKMELSFDPANKASTKQEPHILELEPVPMLLLGSKPVSKNDGDNSVRTSSPASLDMPSTPTKGSRKAQITQPQVVIRKQQTKNSFAAINSKPEMAPVIDTLPETVIESLPSTIFKESILGDVQPTIPQTRNHTSTAAGDKIAVEKPGNSIPTARRDNDGDLIAVTSKNSSKKATEKASVSNGTPEAGAKEIATNVEKPSMSPQSDVAGVIPRTLSAEASSLLTASKSMDLSSAVESTPAPRSPKVQQAIIPDMKDFFKNGSQPFISPCKRATAKPAVAGTDTCIVLQKPSVVPTLDKPIKRALERILTPPPDAKRIKTDVMSLSTPTRLPRPLSASPSPRPLSTEVQIAEQRKQLEAVRNMRAEIAKKKAVIDQRMAPYKQRMVEELERLRQEMAMEEMMAAEDEEEYNATAAMLAEYERAYSEV